MLTPVATIVDTMHRVNVDPPVPYTVTDLGEADVWHPRPASSHERGPASLRISIGKRKLNLRALAELGAAMQVVFRVHPTPRKAELQGSLTSRSPFPYLLVLQWNTTFDR
jgi:hypothetical protein